MQFKGRYFIDYLTFFKNSAFPYQEKFNQFFMKMRETGVMTFLNIYHHYHRDFNYHLRYVENDDSITEINFWNVKWIFFGYFISLFIVGIILIIERKMRS